MYRNLPDELKQYNQWVLWRYVEKNGRQTKIPFTASGHYANVAQPETWCSFEQALSAVSHYDGIGFVLSKSDPFTIIDLDNKPDRPCTSDQLARHQKIFEAFPSYAELSVSGTGLHIVIRGALPSGVHRDNVEAYSDLRFMACTGNVIRNAPVVDCQPLLDILYGEMKPPETTLLVEQEGWLDDSEVVDMAINAANGDKFTTLCNGGMEGYPSQSEADFALLSIIAFYTPDNEQVRRIFRMTALGKRTKAIQDNKYLNRALEKIRAKQPPPVDFTALIQNANTIAEGNLEPAPQTDKECLAALPGITLPPGLIGELATYIYQSSIRPVPEIALTAAIALLAGVVGRSYNISGMGLNHYLTLLAKTGTGKEAAQAGIERIISAVRPQLPMAEEFIGPARFASGQALLRVLSERPCFVSVLGEFGMTLQQLTDPRANAADRTLKQAMLDLYNKSGWNNVLRSTAYSDVEKNTKVVQAPNVTILGESTPEAFFDGLDAGNLADGLIPRFIIVEYHGSRPGFNKNNSFPPPRHVVDWFANVVAAAVTTGNNGVVCQVQQTPDAEATLSEFEAEATQQINTRSCSGPIAEIWNRAHQNAIKLSALVAVGVNHNAPQVTRDIALWAISLVKSSALNLTKRFSEGDIGQGDGKQLMEIRRSIETYFVMSEKELGKYLKSHAVMFRLHKEKVVPYQYLLKRNNNASAFSSDRLGATNAVKRAIQSMVESGELVEIPKVELVKRYGFTGTAYGIGNSW